MWQQCEEPLWEENSTLSCILCEVGSLRHPFTFDLRITSERRRPSKTWLHLNVVGVRTIGLRVQQPMSAHRIDLNRQLRIRNSISIETEFRQTLLQLSELNLYEIFSSFKDGSAEEELHLSFNLLNSNFFARFLSVKHWKSFNVLKEKYERNTLY